MQIYAFLETPERDKWAFVSIAIIHVHSIRGHDPKLGRRHLAQEKERFFYGYEKNDSTSRTSTFIAIFSITLCVSMKTVLLMSVSMKTGLLMSV